MSTALAIEPPATGLVIDLDRIAGPSVRIVPVPRLEPPTDEELRCAGVVAPPIDAPLLPLELPLYTRPHRGHHRRSGPSARGGMPTGMSPQDLAGAGEQVIAPSPCRGAVVRFLGVVFEVAGGFRPAAQLRGLCRQDRFDTICAQITGRHPTRARHQLRDGGFIPATALIGAASAGRRAPLSRHAAAAPLRTGRLGVRAPAPRIAVRHMKICDINDDTAEVSVVLSRAAVVWAVAARMERINGRWLCAHLEII